MPNFEIHTLQNAPEASISTLERVKKTYQHVPNLHGILAESPVALEGYKEG